MNCKICSTNKISRIKKVIESNSKKQLKVLNKRSKKIKKQNIKLKNNEKD